MNKPIALTGLTLLVAVAGVICLLIAIGALQFLGDGRSSNLLISSFAIIGAACMLLAYGLFTVKSWAWPFGIGMVIASIALALLSAISRATLAGIVVSLFPAFALLVGLLLPDVRNLLRPVEASAVKSGVSSPNSKINKPNPEKQTQQQNARKTGRRS